MHMHRQTYAMITILHTHTGGEAIMPDRLVKNYKTNRMDITCAELCIC